MPSEISRFTAAIGAGELALVTAMLAERPGMVHLHCAENDERTPIHFAVLARRPAMVRLLMERGANARCGIYPHREATAALTLAEERGWNEITAIILDAESRRPKPEPAKAEPEIDGALTAAVRSERRDELARLLDAGLDPNERTRLTHVDEEVYSEGMPLWLCAARGEHEMAEMLLARGANPNGHVYAGGSAVYSAYSHRQWDMIPLLQRYGGVVGADTVASYRQTERAREMLASEAAGLPPGTVQPGRTLAEDLLEFGASGGAAEIVGMALERIDWPPHEPRWYGMLRSALSFWNHIPWLYAGNKELDRGTYIDCFRLILARCHANLRGRFGVTMLHEVAAMRDYVTESEGAAFADALLDAGAVVNPREELLLSTPLGWACRWGRTEVARLLLERGADPVEADAEPWATPMAWAVKKGHTGLQAKLKA